MGFTKEEVRRLNFKVQAGNVIDADAGAYWYQALLENQNAKVKVICQKYRPHDGKLCFAAAR